MNEKDKQQLSAILDNDRETSQILAGHFLKILSHDEDLRATATRYQMIGECMRGRTTIPDQQNFADQIRQKIQAEPPIVAPKAKVLQFPSWTKPAMGGAIAATLVLVSFNMMKPATTSTQPSFVSQPTHFQATPVALKQTTIQPVPTMMTTKSQDHWITDNKTLDQRLNRYLIQHSENTSRAGMNGVLPYTTFVSYDSQ